MRLSFAMYVGANVAHVSFDVTYVRIVGSRLVFQRANNYVVEKYALCRVHDIEVRA